MKKRTDFEKMKDRYVVFFIVLVVYAIVHITLVVADLFLYPDCSFII